MKIKKFSLQQDTSSEIFMSIVVRVSVSSAVATRPGIGPIADLATE